LSVSLFKRPSLVFRKTKQLVTSGVFIRVMWKVSVGDKRNRKQYQRQKLSYSEWFSEIRFAFDVYDFKGDGKVDGFYIGDLLRACNLNPTLACIDVIGGQKEKGKKICGLEDFYPIYKEAKDSKDTGGIHDFVEILKLYDKNEDNTILGNELFRLLTNLGKFAKNALWQNKPCLL
jgi:Ca2+-binding EF-hand superfamily protein